MCYFLNQLFMQYRKPRLINCNYGPSLIRNLQFLKKPGNKPVIRFDSGCLRTIPARLRPAGDNYHTRPHKTNNLYLYLNPILMLWNSSANSALINTLSIILIIQTFHTFITFQTIQTKIIFSDNPYKTEYQTTLSCLNSRNTIIWRNLLIEYFAYIFVKFVLYCLLFLILCILWIVLII